jgi:hypothetical protein
MPSWKLKKTRRRRLKTERRAHVARTELRTRRHYASMFITFIDYFICFLRPAEVQKLIGLSRESASRHWDMLLTQYMRYFYWEEYHRLLGNFLSAWLVPVRTKLATVLNRACLCGAVTDQFDFVEKKRLCLECARLARVLTYSFTTPLFYDEEVFATVNMWTPDPVALIETIPTGKRVEIDGSIVIEYDNIVVENAIWISGINKKRSKLRTGSFAMVLRASVYLTDLTISNGSTTSPWDEPNLLNIHPPAIQVMRPLSYDFHTVRISDCLITGRAGAGVLVQGGHVVLRKNHFQWCAHSAITCHGGTVDAVHNRFRRLLSWCLQDTHRPDDVPDVIATFRANNDIRSRGPHFCFPNILK